MKPSVRVGRLCLLLMACCASGCGGKGDLPEIGSVYGTVKLGGKPLAKASVQFAPEKARPSVGFTDAEGKYELTYSRESKGAVIGNHVVRVSTGVIANPDKGIEGVPETVPAKYNIKTSLKHEVKAGKNEINLDLDIQGDIIQPTIVEN